MCAITSHAPAPPSRCAITHCGDCGNQLGLRRRALAYLGRLSSPRPGELHRSGHSNQEWQLRGGGGGRHLSLWSAVPGRGVSNPRVFSSASLDLGGSWLGPFSAPALLPLRSECVS